jgi:hypothetical protein
LKDKIVSVSSFNFIRPTMTMFFLQLLLVVGFVSAQTGAEIAYDLFDYNSASASDLASNGGRGFAAACRLSGTGRTPRWRHGAILIHGETRN